MFVPKTHADSGLFLLLQAAELSREWQKEVVVVQLDVKKAFDHVDHGAVFKAMGLQKFEPIFDGFDRSSLEWKLHESALGRSIVDQSSNDPRLPQGAMESPVIVRDLTKSWKIWKLA